MKKLLFIAIICTANISLGYAQFQKDQKFISGGFSLYSNKSSSNQTNSTSSFQSNINFSYGKFISALRATGWGIAYGYNNSKYNNINTYNNDYTHSIALNYFSTYYTREPLIKNVYGVLNWNTSAGYNFGKLSGDNSSGYNIGSSLSPGLTFKKNNSRFLVNAYLNQLVGLNYNHTESANGFTNNVISLQSGLTAGVLGNIVIGFTYLLK